MQEHYYDNKVAVLSHYIFANICLVHWEFLEQAKDKNKNKHLKLVYWNRTRATFRMLRTH